MKRKVKSNARYLWIGTQPEPDDRLKIRVSKAADAEASSLRGDRTGRKVLVKDLDSGKEYVVQAADCGADCRCALQLANSPKAGA